MNLVQSIVLFGEAVSSKGVVLSQKRIFHNKQFLQKGFLTCICHLNVSSCCAFHCLVRRFVRYSGARPFRDLNTITHV